MKTGALTAKPHFVILDGLRGVAALMVVAFHLFEAHAGGNRFVQIINHGYLAVDFFFLLSGFVIGYAYDDRWDKITIGGFFKRRLVRLQPMVIMGMIIGALAFYYQASPLWPSIEQTPVWKVLLVMVIGFTIIPVPISLDIRGWQEMHPLDGPGWSLFFEYIGNILYALVVRKFSKTALAVLVFLSACLLVHLNLTGEGDVIGGWSLDGKQLHIGFSRLLYPFFAGLLLSRMAKITYVKQAFLLCSILIIAALSVPRFGGSEQLWMNGIYESACIIFIFPLIVYLGASGQIATPFASRICKFLGDISYPIYITHYPLIYIYTAWVYNTQVSLKDAFPTALLVFVSSIVIAYACLKFYDEPIRRWLRKKVLKEA